MLFSIFSTQVTDGCLFSKFVLKIEDHGSGKMAGQNSEARKWIRQAVDTIMQMQHFRKREERHHKCRAQTSVARVRSIVN